jgi:hypothetical protein
MYYFRLANPHFGLTFENEQWTRGSRNATSAQLEASLGINISKVVYWTLTETYHSLCESTLHDFCRASNLMFPAPRYDMQSHGMKQKQAAATYHNQVYTMH